MTNSSLVNCFIVGAAKCGTTTVHHLLSKHPQVYAGPIKEPTYFALPEFTPSAAFKSHTCPDEASYRSNYAGASSQRYLLDSSVHYLYFPQSAQRIATYNPNAKIIILLRDPADRLYSHYKMLRKEGATHLPFAQFIKHPIDNNQIDLIKMGEYSSGIVAFQAAFPPQNLLILPFDLLKDQTQLRQILCAFLGLESFPQATLEHENSSGIPRHEALRYLHMSFAPVLWLKRVLPKSSLRSKVGAWIIRTFYSNPPMDADIRQQLNARYALERKKLQAMGITWKQSSHAH